MNSLQDLNTDTNILIVGLGVIGGGYASALSKKGYRVRCITKEQKDIDYALERGMIASGSTEVDAETVGAADLIIFALYPHIFVNWIKQYQHLFQSGTLITDVTGVKGCVVDEVQKILREDVEFIAAHPMAGRERSGV
ncbi:MAG: prephenate dehydrogenase [Clostridia bacterium]|nr:prephenate dehydrogenase [Clostridia bacterium]